MKAFSCTGKNAVFKLALTFLRTVCIYHKKFPVWSLQDHLFFRFFLSGFDQEVNQIIQAGRNIAAGENQQRQVADKHRQELGNQHFDNFVC